MKNTQNQLNVQSKEEVILNKWLAMVFGIKYKTSHIAKFLNWFFVDKDGPLKECLMWSLEPIVDSGTILKDTLKNLDPHDGIFLVNQFTDGPITVLP